MSERKERTITIRLTESDCKTLMNKCGEHGITINVPLGNSGIKDIIMMS